MGAPPAPAPVVLLPPPLGRVARSRLSGRRAAPPRDAAAPWGRPGRTDFRALAAVGQLTVEFHCDPVFGYGGNEEVEQLLDEFERHGFLALDFHDQRRLDVLLINRHLHPIGWRTRQTLRLRYRPPTWLQRLKARLPTFLKRHPERS